MKLIHFLLPFSFVLFYTSCSTPNNEEEIVPSVTKGTTPHQPYRIEVDYILDDSIEESKGKIKAEILTSSIDFGSKSLFINISCKESKTNREVPLFNNVSQGIKTGVYLVEYSIVRKHSSENKIKSRLPINNISKPLAHVQKLIVVRAGYITKIHLVFE